MKWYSPKDQKIKDHIDVCENCHQVIRPVCNNIDCESCNTCPTKKVQCGTIKPKKKEVVQ